MFEADITKVVEEMCVRIRETEEDFILDTIFPYCQETLQRKINKEELKQIILRGSRPKGKWIGEKPYPICDKCGCNIYEEYISCSDFAEIYKPMKYCPKCGAEMGV